MFGWLAKIFGYGAAPMDAPVPVPPSAADQHQQAEAPRALPPSCPPSLPPSAPPPPWHQASVVYPPVTLPRTPLPARPLPPRPPARASSGPPPRLSPPPEIPIPPPAPLPGKHVVPRPPRRG